MASTGARTAGASHAHAHDAAGRTPAQLYCLLGGAALLLAGLAGFIAEPSFGDADERGKLLLFDVNGWHNVVHILSGVVLLAAASKWRTAKAVALGFGVVYGLVAVIGLIQGDSVLGIIPINGADNVLHVGLAALGVVAALISQPKD